MNLLAAANQALAELREYHADHGTCPEPNLCPTAVAIRDLEAAIAEEGTATQVEASYPPMKIEDIAAAVIEAQSGIGK